MFALCLLSPQNELVAVLKANHLATAKSVAKKAQTIMKQADGDGSGTLTLDEFLVVAQKFPNLVRLLLGTQTMHTILSSVGVQGSAL